MARIKPNPTELEIEKCRKNIAFLEEQVNKANTLISIYENRLNHNLEKLKDSHRFVTA